MAARIRMGGFVCLHRGNRTVFEGNVEEIQAPSKKPSEYVEIMFFRFLNKTFIC